ncbi:MAG: AsmA family protein, partial [Burkholderiaceae bacterium]|nr:AsmA family protein [Burkholderiaceae bacterium]
MMRIAKIIGFMLAGLLLLLAGCAAFVYYYDWSGARAQVDSAVSAKLQRKFAINGPLAVTWTHDDSIPGWRGYLPWP